MNVRELIETLQVIERNDPQSEVKVEVHNADGNDVEDGDLLEITDETGGWRQEAHCLVIWAEVDA